MLKSRFILTTLLALFFVLPVAKDGNSLFVVHEVDAYHESAEAAHEIAEIERIVKADNIINTALKYLGVKYSYGNSSPKGFDCSGFTRYVFNEENIQISRTSHAQFNDGERINKTNDLKPGDLVFFGSRATPNAIGHVGIVVEVDSETGRFKFVHASRQGIKVDESTEQYYSRRYIGARRIIK